MKKDNPILSQLTQDIVQLLSPEKIIVFSQKQSTAGNLTSVKLCIIIADGDSKKAEHRLYMELENDLPFDALVYTHTEWQHLLETPYSFAGRIQEMGRVIYEAL